jgi:hypothetical protein
MVDECLNNQKLPYTDSPFFRDFLDSEIFQGSKETYKSTSSKNFKIRFTKLDTWHVVQVRFWEEA